MRILDLVPAAVKGGGSTRLLATFDAELSDDVRIQGLKLVEALGGKRVVYAPNGNGGRRLATFSPALAAAITKAAANKLEGHDTANGTTS